MAYKKASCGHTGRKYSFRTNLGVFGLVFCLFCGRRSHTVDHRHSPKTENHQLVSFDDNRGTNNELNTSWGLTKGNWSVLLLFLAFLGLWACFLSGKGLRQSSRNKRGYHSYFVASVMLSYFSPRKAGKHSWGCCCCCCCLEANHPTRTPYNGKEGVKSPRPH